MSENEVGGIDSSRLNSLIERIERLEEEKKGISSDIRDIYAEAKGVGFDVKIMRTIIKLRNSVRCIFHRKSSFSPAKFYA